MPPVDQMQQRRLPSSLVEQANGPRGGPAEAVRACAVDAMTAPIASKTNSRLLAASACAPLQCEQGCPPRAHRGVLDPSSPASSARLEMPSLV
jgi:hypothetical protein